jgi:hypothetical protein
MGVVRAHFVVGEDGVPTSVEYEGHQILVPGAKDSIENGTFPIECRGRELGVVYGFNLDSPDYKSTIVLFDPPRDFIISTGIPMPDQESTHQR